MLRCLTLENIHYEDILAGLRHTPNLVQLQVGMLLSKMCLLHACYKLSVIICYLASVNEI
jgi:hypothetical protein